MSIMVADPTHEPDSRSGRPRLKLFSRIEPDERLTVSSSSNGFRTLLTVTRRSQARNEPSRLRSKTGTSRMTTSKTSCVRPGVVADIGYPVKPSDDEGQVTFLQANYSDSSGLVA